jgi:hypothetical protein
MNRNKNNMSIVLVSTLIIIIISISVILPNVCAEEFNAKELGLKFEYDKSWKLVSGADPSTCDRTLCIFTLKNVNDDNTSIAIWIHKGHGFKNLCKCDSLVEFVQWDYTKHYEPIKTFSLINDNQTTLNGNITTMQMEYITGGGNNTQSHYFISWIKNNEILIKNNDIYYKIAYQSNNKNFNQFLSNTKNILNSIELFDPNKKIQTVSADELQPVPERKNPSFMIGNNKNEKQVNGDNSSRSIITNEKTNSISENDKQSSYKPEDKIREKMQFDDSNFDEYYSNTFANTFQNANITGKIFNLVPSSSIEKAVQIFHLGNNDKSVYIGYSPANQNIKDSFNKDDCIRVIGTTGPSLEYTNAFGAYRTSPSIMAKDIHKIDCLDMVDPTAKVITIGQTLEKGGIKVTLNKVEFDDKNTRAFLTIENTNNDEEEILRFYDTSDSKAFQGKRQYEAQYSSSYPDISSSIPPGIEESGVVLFEPLKYDVDTKFQFDMNMGFGEDYKFVFNTNSIDQLNNEIDISQVFGGEEENSQDESETKNDDEDDDD